MSKFKPKTLMDFLVQRMDTTEAPPGMQSVLDAVKLGPELDAQIQRKKVNEDAKAALVAACITALPKPKLGRPPKPIDPKAEAAKAEASAANKKRAAERAAVDGKKKRKVWGEDAKVIANINDGGMKRSFQPPPSRDTQHGLIGAHLVLLVCVLARAASSLGAAAAPDVDGAQPRQQASLPSIASGGRRLLSRRLAAVPPLDAAATRRAQRDAEPDTASVPQPRLYYEGDLLIWAPEDTLPRDMLARRPEVWLYSVLPADYAAAALLPHFLEHYSRLGIAPDRMLFVVNHNPSAPGAEPEELRRTAALLGAFGADFLVWRGQYSPQAHLEVQLAVLRRVPVQDWVLAADGDELQDYGGLAAQLFLERREREGANWVRGVTVDRVSTSGRLRHVAPAPPGLATQFPLLCDVARHVGHVGNVKVAAFRAFLRPDVGGIGIVAPELARSTFGEAGPEAGAHREPCGGDNLHDLTPYARWWQYYRTPTMVGNAYLWYPRVADAQVKVHHFRWRAGAERQLADRLRHYSGAACAGVPAGTPGVELRRELERLLEGVGVPGGVDVNNATLGCALAPRLVRLPLGEGAARGLVVVRRVAAQHARRRGDQGTQQAEA